MIRYATTTTRTASLSESRGTSVLEATQNRISIGSRARPASLVVTCRATECRVMSHRIMCRVVSYRAMLCRVMLFHVYRVMLCRIVVSPFRVVSCRVLSRPVVSMWWSPSGVCAQASFARGSCQSHSTDSDQIANGTPASNLLILEVFQKKKKKRPLGFPSAGTRQTQRARMNNAPEHDPRRRMFGLPLTTVRAVRILVFPVKKMSFAPPGQDRPKKKKHMGSSDSAAKHRTSVEK